MLQSHLGMSRNSFNFVQIQAQMRCNCTAVVTLTPGHVCWCHEVPPSWGILGVRARAWGQELAESKGRAECSVQALLYQLGENWYLMYTS